MSKVIIIDDEPLARSIVKEYLMAYPDMEVVQECGDGFEGVKAISSLRPDLIFLDIQMPKINGFEMLELLDEPPGVIFTTAFDEYAMQAFEAHAVDYLLKPFSFERFLKAANRARARHRAVSPPPPDNPPQPGYIFIKGDAKHKYHRLHLGSIHYIEGLRNYVRFIGEDGRIVSLQNLGALEEELPGQQFARIHKSYIVNLRHVQEVDGNSLLVAGRRLPIGGSYRAAFHRLIEAYRLGL